jgi:hypothetical protein
MAVVVPDKPTRNVLLPDSRRLSVKFDVDASFQAGMQKPSARVDQRPSNSPKTSLASVPLPDDTGAIERVNVADPPMIVPDHMRSERLSLSTPF